MDKTGEATHTEVVGGGEAHGGQVGPARRVHVRHRHALAAVERTHHLCHRRHRALQFPRRPVEGKGATHALAEPASRKGHCTDKLIRFLPTNSRKRKT